MMYVAMGSVVLAYILGVSLAAYNLKNIKEFNNERRKSRK